MGPVSMLYAHAPLIFVAAFSRLQYVYIHGHQLVRRPRLHGGMSNLSCLAEARSL